MRRSALALSAFALVLSLTATASAAQHGVPALTGRVVDRADLLSPEVEAALTDRLAAHEDATSNQIAILTVPSLDGENLELWATEVFRSWGLGREDANNGVLLLIARDDREIRIEVGYGLEGALPDATAGAIIRNEMTPRFRDGDFEGGTLAATDAIIGSIRGEYVPTEDELPWWGQALVLLLMAAVPIGITVGNFLERPVVRYALLVFTAPFASMSGLAFATKFTEIRESVAFVASIVIFVVLFIVIDLMLSRQSWLREKRRHYQKKTEAFKAARRAGRTSVIVDGRSYSVPSGGGSGGGFSGGGGSSGGGGASGGW